MLGVSEARGHPYHEPCEAEIPETLAGIWLPRLDQDDFSRVVQVTPAGLLTVSDSEGRPGSSKLFCPQPARCPVLTDTYLETDKRRCACSFRDVAVVCGEECYVVEWLHSAVCRAERQMYTSFLCTEETQNKPCMTAVSALCELPIPVRHVQAVCRSQNLQPWPESCNDKHCTADRTTGFNHCQQEDASHPCINKSTSTKSQWYTEGCQQDC